MKYLLMVALCLTTCLTFAAPPLPQDPLKAPQPTFKAQAPVAIEAETKPAVAPRNPLLPTPPGVTLQVVDPAPAPSLPAKLSVPGEDPNIVVPPAPPTNHQTMTRRTVRRPMLGGQRLVRRGFFFRR